jgi:hypothetical protein
VQKELSCSGKKVILCLWRDFKMEKERYGPHFQADPNYENRTFLNWLDPMGFPSYTA